MKLTVENKRVTFMSLFLGAAILAGLTAHSPTVYAQDDVFDEAEDALADSDSLQMDQIEIEGKLSPSELLKRRRDKLEERNRIMVEKKIENIRVKQEIALTNKLQGAFDKSLNNNTDKVEVVQAAPVAVPPAPVVQAPVVETKIVEVPVAVTPEEKKSKIIPMLGTSNIKGDRIDLDSNMSIALNAETLITPQFSVGLGVGYTTVDLTDVSNDFVPGGFGSIFNNQIYTGAFGVNGREMTLKKISVEANAKLFFVEDAKIKPYIGAGVNFNRSTLKYDNQSNIAFNNINFGNEDYSSSAVAGIAKLGAEASFSETIGLNVEFSYAKNISSGLSKSSQVSSLLNPDQARLENIQREIEDGSVRAIQAGLVIKF